MSSSTQAAWQENRAGLTGSLLLHGLALALWLNWSLVHPTAPEPPLKAMLVDLVHLPVIAPGPEGGAVEVGRPRPAIAPHPSGVRPQGVTPPRSRSPTPPQFLFLRVRWSLLHYT